MDQIKSQLLTVFALKGGDSKDIGSIIYGLIVMEVINLILKAIPAIIDRLTNLLKKKTSDIKTFSINTKASIVFTRVYDNKREDTITDALLSYMSNIDEARDLIFTNIYIVTKKDKFVIFPEINVKVLDKEFKDNNLSRITFEVFSDTLTLSELKKWADSIFVAFETFKKNKLGDKKYCFEEIMLPNSGSRTITFMMTPFVTNKSLSNLFGEHIDIIKNRLVLFKDEKWYAEIGIPRTLGIMMSGPPGAGKTSTIKAIANDTSRHIFTIKLSEKTTTEQLKRLFYTDIATCSQEGNLSSLIIPQKERLYVFEDIDCLSTIVLDRKSLHVEEEKVPEKGTIEYNNYMYDKKNKPEKNEDKLTLQFLLNLFDGILEIPGRIMILTSNYPEKLDKALIRPGRIDINLVLDKCSENMIIQTFYNFYKKTIKKEDIEGVLITPAQLQNILCLNIKDHKKALDLIREKTNIS